MQYIAYVISMEFSQLICTIFIFIYICLIGTRWVLPIQHIKYLGFLTYNTQSKNPLFLPSATNKPIQLKSVYYFFSIHVSGSPSVTNLCQWLHIVSPNLCQQLGIISLNQCMLFQIIPLNMCSASCVKPLAMFR